MKYKWLVCLFVIFIVGCSKNASNEVAKGKIYNHILLNDTQANVSVFESIVPEGFKGYVESKWDVVNSSYPGLEVVTISSPDSLAKITFYSQQSYTESNRYNEGVNYDYYTTYLHYMDASTYLDYFLKEKYGNVEYVKDLETDPDILNQVNAFNKIKYEQEKNTVNALNLPGYGITNNLTEIGSTISKRQYKLGDNYLEGSTAVTGLNSEFITQFYTQNDKFWIIPYVIVYSAENEEAFNKYYDDYSFIVANSHFTVDYYAMIEYVSSYIVQMYTAAYAAKSQASLDAMNDYIDSNYSSTSSESTNDKVMRMWDDYINDVDEYKTLDGGTFKASIFDDVVAQKDNEIYVGSKAGIPYGFTELEKNY